MTESPTVRLISILIKNFQAHESLKFSFDKNVTSIVGETDSGKSSIVRAISWVLCNDRRGTSFIRHGADQCLVKIKFIGSDGEKHIVGRRRSRSQVNEYILDDKILKGFKNEVPEQIQTLTGIQDHNIQKQIDIHFWVHLSPAEISRRMNKIVDMDALDRYRKRANSGLTESKGALKYEKESLESLESKKEEMRLKTARVKRFSEMRERGRELSELETEISALEEYWESWLEVSKPLPKVPDLEPLVELEKEIGSTRSQISKIKSHQTAILQCEAAIESAESELEEVNKELSKIKICPTCGTEVKEKLQS